MKSKYQKLYEFIPYFENLSKDKKALTKEGDSFALEFHPLYTIYAQEMNDFAKCIYEVDFVDYSYRDTLDHHGINDLDDMDHKIPTADEKLLKGILTQMIRDERFNSGAWVSYAEKDLFLKVLRRLVELDEGSS